MKDFGNSWSPRFPAYQHPAFYGMLIGVCSMLSVILRDMLPTSIPAGRHLFSVFTDLDVLIEQAIPVGYIGSIMAMIFLAGMACYSMKRRLRPWHYAR